MKHIYSCLIILTFFTSCADDEKNGQDGNPTANQKGSGDDILPAYSNNPYDNAGQIYDEIFDAYYDGSVRPTQVQSIITQVETIANANISFTTINNSGYLPLSKERVEYLASKSSADIVGIVGTSHLSSYAKVSFSNFLLTAVALYETETDALKMYNAITRYEATVIANESFSANDKRILLTTTSIIRYTSYRAKKRPKKNTDPDWIIFIGHVFGTEEGAEESSAKAIIEGLVTGIVSNK